MQAVLDPFISKLRNLNIKLVSYNIILHPSFYDHYQHYTFPSYVYSTNVSLEGRLVPRETVRKNLPGLIDVFREISTNLNYPVQGIPANSIDVTHDHVGNKTDPNAILPAWRDALYNLNTGVGYDVDALMQEMQQVQTQLNE